MTHDDETLALIAAAYEDATQALHDTHTECSFFADEHGKHVLERALANLTPPSDAQAALNRMLRRAKNEALEAAAKLFHTEQLRIYADEILGSLSMDNVLRIETYDEKVLAYQSVAIELAAFPAAIRAMKEPEE